MTVPKEEKSIYQRSRSPNPSDRKRSHKHVEVCVIGAIEVIGKSMFVDKLLMFSGIFKAQIFFYSNDTKNGSISVNLI